jgi:hypothetical protein
MTRNGNTSGVYFVDASGLAWEIIIFDEVFKILLDFTVLMTQVSVPLVCKSGNRERERGGFSAAAFDIAIVYACDRGLVMEFLSVLGRYIHKEGICCSISGIV